MYTGITVNQLLLQEINLITDLYRKRSVTYTGDSSNPSSIQGDRDASPIQGEVSHLYRERSVTYTGRQRCVTYTEITPNVLRIQGKLLTLRQTRLYGPVLNERQALGRNYHANAFIRCSALQACLVRCRTYRGKPMRHLYRETNSQPIQG